MSFDLNIFIGEFDGGARAYSFMYVPPAPIDEKYKYYVRATSLPESTIEEAEITWRGFSYRLGNRRQYGDWTVTFSSDRKYNLRQQFENWMNSIAKRATYGGGYMYDQSLLLLDSMDKYSWKELKLYSAWPKNIGPVTLDYSSMDVAQFDVTFSFMDFEFV
jgi:hypothetical protein